MFVPDDLRQELRSTFRPVRLTGNASALREVARARGQLRVVDAASQPRPPTGLTNGQIVWLALGAAAVGAVVGWVWRKQREVLVKTKPRDLVGLDVVASLS